MTDGDEKSEADYWDELPKHNEKGNFDPRPTRTLAAATLNKFHEFVTPHPETSNVKNTPLYHYQPAKGSFDRGGAGWVHQYAGARVIECNHRDLNEIVNRVKRGSFIERRTFDAGRHEDMLINLSNGVYNLDSGELLDHSPDYRFRTTIPQTYDPDAECPNITAFIEEIVPGEQERRTLFEWAGFCLATDYPINRFLILHGGGRNGKSVYLNLLREFLGGPEDTEDNVTGAQLDTIIGGQFGVAALEDSLLNVDAESADTRLGPEQLNSIKGLTGGDVRQVERKFEEPFELQNTAKLVFAANNPPRFEEDTDAIADRLLAIELPYRFKQDHEDDPDADKEARDSSELLAEMTTDEELSGFLNKALAGLQRIREKGRFSIEDGDTSRQRFEEYQTRHDSIRGFAVNCLENEQGFALPKNGVYNAYKSYCEANDHTPTKRAAFFRQLRRKTELEINDKRPTIEASNGDRYRPRVLDHCWVSTDGIAHLSDSARDETVSIIRAIHGDNNADFAYDKFFRPDAADPSRIELSQNEKASAVNDSVAAVCNRDDGCEHARHDDVVALAKKQGVAESDTEHILGTLLKNGDIIEFEDGQYRLND